MELIIDGYNVLALEKRLDRGLEQSRNLLIGRLARYRQAKPMSLTVVFDGWRSGGATETNLQQDGITIVYSRLGEKADAVVIRLARQKNNGVVVVSSDREIRNAVERFGAVAIHAQEFYDILEELEFPGTAEEFADWQDDPPNRSGRISKIDRKRQDSLRKLRL